MKCTLMHKTISVAEIELDDATGYIKKINNIIAEEHLPVGVAVKKGMADRATLNDWWTDRSIPASRSGIRDAMETLDIKSTKMLLVRCYGLKDGRILTEEDVLLRGDQIHSGNNHLMRLLLLQ